MFTTAHFSKNPNYYGSNNDWRQEKKYNTNPRYKDFCQTHFTAGDVQQFSVYRNKFNRLENNKITLGKNIFANKKLSSFWEKYKNLSHQSVDNTFFYMFFKFKKGIFVQIKDNKLSVFLPFSNKNFINEWSHLVKIDPKFGSFPDFLKYIYSLEGWPFNPRSINSHMDMWYCNNHLLRYEYPINEGDTNHPAICDMLLELCNKRKLPDIEFFINRRDSPVITTNETEAYDHIFGTIPLVSHNYKEYSPILGMAGREGYADIPIPTADDWARVSENKHFMKTKVIVVDKDSVKKWEDRKDIAVFRGSSTGAGVTLDTNPRLKVCELSVKYPDIIDAGITKWVLRPRKLKNEEYIQTIDISTLPFGLKSSLNHIEQMEYKYLIHISGHVSAFRLSTELSMGSVILLVQSEYCLWFQPLLKEYTHFIPVKSDLSDLIDKITWCRQNDKKCKIIAENARSFYDKYLSENAILDYWQKLLHNLKKHTGSYTYPEEDRYIRPDFNGRENKSFTEEKSCLKEVEINLTNEKLIIEKEGRQVFLSDFFVDENVDPKKIIRKTGDYNEIIHETFIGTKLNNLRMIVPNFIHTYGYNSNNIYLEYIQNTRTFFQYINSPDFLWDDYLNILVQIILSLNIAQQYCSFTHYDLTPWNILIYKSSHSPRIIQYPCYPDVWTVEFKYIPVLIDYGRSSIDNSNRIIDVLSILLTTLFQITRFKLTEEEKRKVLILGNFLSPFSKIKFDLFSTASLKSLNHFCDINKKYSTLLFSNKHSLADKNPLDLINYIYTNFSPKFLEKKNKLNLSVFSKNKFTIPNFKSKILKAYYLSLQGERYFFDKGIEIYKKIKEEVKTTKYGLSQTLFDAEKEVKEIKEINWIINWLLLN